MLANPSARQAQSDRPIGTMSRTGNQSILNRPFRRLKKPRPRPVTKMPIVQSSSTKPPIPTIHDSCAGTSWT